MKKLRIDSAARAELQAAFEWYEAQRPELGTDFLSEANRQLDKIGKWPELGAPIPNIAMNLRRVLLDRFPYYVIYHPEYENALVVVAIAHTSRRPGYWKDRLRPP